MDRFYYNEMKNTLEEFKEDIRKKTVFIFGHCEASFALSDMLMDNDIFPVSILDNSPAKIGLKYKDIPVTAPDKVLHTAAENAVVLIVTRFYESMNRQLRDMGFEGDIIKLVDYNTYAEYSLTEDTINRKKQRIIYGQKLLDKIKEKYPLSMIIFCPFNALGDVYFCMSYLPEFLKKKGVKERVICAPSLSCAKVAELFGAEHMEILPQKDLDAATQAAIYTKDEKCFIAHHDRPYVVNLHKALYNKCIPLDTIYRCGVFGLPVDTKPAQPVNLTEYNFDIQIVKGKTIIISPYAKSVPALPDRIWDDLVADLSKEGYEIYTNVAGEEKPLAGTRPISPEISQMKDAVEKAGMFIGIRSGMCDIIRTADCKKAALYPDYNYCDTKWKSIDMYGIEGFENIVIEDADTWEKIKKKTAWF